MVEIAIMAPGRARRDWLEQTLRREASFHLTAAAGTFPMLRSMLSETGADVVIVDLASDQAETNAEWLNELFDLAALIVLGSDVDQQTFNNMLHSASGALLRSDASAEQIVRAIHA